MSIGILLKLYRVRRKCWAHSIDRPVQVKRALIRYLLGNSAPAPKVSREKVSKGVLDLSIPPLSSLSSTTPDCPSLSQPFPPVPFLISQPFFIQSICAELNPGTQQAIQASSLPFKRLAQHTSSVIITWAPPEVPVLESLMQTH